jgi:hypothetical protein
MAQNDIVLLDSLVSRAKNRFGGQADDSELFELFCFEQVLKDLDPTYEELESGWTDGPEDGGIDGFFVYIDGRPASPLTIRQPSRINPDISVVFFSVKRTAAFQQDPINAIALSLVELLDLRKANDALAYPFNDAVINQRSIFHDAFVSLADKRPRINIVINYCSRGDTATLADNLTTRAAQLKDSLTALFSNASVDVHFQGAVELLNLARRQATYSLRLKFVENYISREGRNYVVLASLPEYCSFISDENGKLRRYLFESNVRDYLGEITINEDIKGSLSRRLPADREDFWWLNNGVTILATHATVVGKEIHLENVQIVNGLQTTETIYRYFSEGGSRSDDRAVMLKIILSSDEETRTRIIKATNYQNTVDLSSLRGLDKIQKDIEHFLLDSGWFYDRRKNFYKNQGKPADRIVSVPYLAGAVRAIALGRPGRSARHRSRTLRDQEVYAEIFNPGWDLRVYLASLEIVSAVELALRARKSTYETPPMTAVHFIGYVYVCRSLGRSRYKPIDVSGLAARPPTKPEVLEIQEQLEQAEETFGTRTTNVGKLSLSWPFVDAFVKSLFGAQEANSTDAGAAFAAPPTFPDSKEVDLLLHNASNLGSAAETATAGFDVLWRAVSAFSGTEERFPLVNTIVKMAVTYGHSRQTCDRAIRLVMSVRSRALRFKPKEKHRLDDNDLPNYLRAVRELIWMIRAPHSR